jgi:hypothetical protein
MRRCETQFNLTPIIWFDKEGYPHVQGGLEYLFGALLPTRKQVDILLYCNELFVPWLRLIDWQLEIEKDGSLLLR